MARIYNGIALCAILAFCISAYADPPIQSKEGTARIRQEKYQSAIQRLESTANENRAFCGKQYRSMPEMEYGSCVARIFDSCSKCMALEQNESAGCLNECISNLLPEDYPDIKVFKERARAAYAKAFE